MAKPKQTTLKASNGTVHGNDSAADAEQLISFCKLAKGQLTLVNAPITCGLCKKIEIARASRAAHLVAQSKRPEIRHAGKHTSSLTTVQRKEKASDKRKATRAKGAEMVAAAWAEVNATKPRVPAAERDQRTGRVKPASFTVTDGRQSATAINRQTDRGDVGPLVQLQGIAYRVSVHELLNGGGFLAIWFVDGRMPEREYRTMTWKLRKGYNNTAPMYENMVRTLSDLVIADVRREAGNTK